MKLAEKKHQDSLEEMKKHFASVIRETVNGKIDKLNDKLELYIKEDKQWKSDNEAALDNMKNLSTGWKVFLTFCASVGIIAAGIGGFKSIFNK